MTSDKQDVLEEFYKRIAPIVERKGGRAVPIMLTRTITVQTATPQTEGIRGLRAEMPGDIEVEFAPADSLRVGNVINVRATRKHQGRAKDNHFTFSFGPDGKWMYAGQPVTDEDIEACLIVTGPPLPAY